MCEASAWPAQEPRPCGSPHSPCPHPAQQHHAARRLLQQSDAPDMGALGSQDPFSEDAGAPSAESPAGGLEPIDEEPIAAPPTEQESPDLLHGKCTNHSELLRGEIHVRCFQEEHFVNHVAEAIAEIFDCKQSADNALRCVGQVRLVRLKVTMLHIRPRIEFAAGISPSGHATSLPAGICRGSRALRYQTLRHAVEVVAGHEAALVRQLPF